MIRSLYFSQDGQLQTNLAKSAFSTALKDRRGLLWVDFEATQVEEDEPIMREVFGFHPLAIDDALAETHVPKLDDWGEYLYIVIHAVIYDEGFSDFLRTQELDVFIGKNYIVTHHDDKIAAIEQVWSRLGRDERHLKNGADHLLYRLVDEVVTGMMPVIEELDDEIDRAEDQIFEGPTTPTLERIFNLKRAVLHLRRIIGPQREVLNKLARDDYGVIDAHERIYFRDVYDHLVRFYDIAESQRDLIGGALDTYLSVINNRMNDIMKTLTLITTLFMPISFVAGFFGMNFFAPVEPGLAPWTGDIMFILMMALTIVMPVSMYFLMRRRGWV